MLRIFYKIYLWLIAIPVFFVATVLTALIVIMGCLLGGERFFSYYPGVLWSRIACILTLCRINVQGRENIQKGRSYVFVSNHQSAYDIFFIYGYLGSPIKWMMKKGISKIPLVGFACRMAGFIFVDQSNAVKARESITAAKKKLNYGRSIFIFPEGARTSDGHLGQFKRGAYQISADLQLPIIPITLNGPYHVLPIGSLDVNPHKMEMIIHPQILPQKDEKTQMRELVETTKKTIHDSLWEEFK